MNATYPAGTLFILECSILLMIPILHDFSKVSSVSTSKNDSLTRRDVQILRESVVFALSAVASLLVVYSLSFRLQCYLINVKI